MDQPYVQPLLSFMAIAVSVMAIVYTRSNIKGQKYIETISLQRMKWIDTLRNDLAEILSGINLPHYVEDGNKKFDEYIDNVGYVSEADEISGKKYLENLKMLKTQLNISVNKVELIKKIDISILRLNQIDDIKLVKMLDQAKEFVLSDMNDYEKVIKFSNELRSEMATVLKIEWDKVKNEVIVGGAIRGIYKIIFKYKPNQG